MPDLTSPKLTKRQYFVVASLLFGLFFGAGNLIFPLHLGQLAGSHWVGAAPSVPAQYQQVALLVFSAVFFGLAFAFSYRENSILANVGKVVNHH